MQPRKIGFYIHGVLYNRGGTEAYTVRMAGALSRLYPEAELSFVSECYSPSDSKGDAEFCSILKERYGIEFDSKKVHLIALAANEGSRFGRLSLRKRISDSSKAFDLFFYCSRGNLSFKARHNIAIIHFPINKEACLASASSFLSVFYNKMMFSRFAKSFDAFLPNSEFTESYLKEYWPEIAAEKMMLLYPPIAPVPRLDIKKEKLIFVCSRIDASKKLELLVDAYRSSQYLHDNYKLAIAGNNAEDTLDYWEKIRSYSVEDNIAFYPNASWDKIVELYNRAELFWHCKGYGENDPYMMEHFGMTTVEAMGAGCVPLVINKGGQAEIVTQECGFKWDSPEQLVRHSEELAKDGELLCRMSEAARRRASFFYMDSFRERLKAILEKVLADDGR